MQTFLPYTSFFKVAGILDNKRLNKQIVEAWQILTDRVPNKNHPACLMWKNNKGTLALYIKVLCREYTKRFDRVHSIQEKINDLESYTAFKDKDIFFLSNDPERTRIFCMSHKVNLLRKNFTYYREKFGIKTDSYEFLNEYTEGYFWPISHGETSKKHSLGWVEYYRIHPYEDTYAINSII